MKKGDCVIGKVTGTSNLTVLKYGLNSEVLGVVRKLDIEKDVVTIDWERGLSVSYHPIKSIERKEFIAV